MPEILPRRHLLWAAGTAISGGAALGLGGTLRLLIPEERTSPLINAGRPEGYAPRSLRLLSSAPVFVWREDRGFAALSACCPHLGCLVQRRGPGYACPCHGSDFDEHGAWLRGPAPCGLRWLRVEVTSTAVLVDAQCEVPAGTFVESG